MTSYWKSREDRELLDLPELPALDHKCSACGATDFNSYNADWNKGVILTCDRCPKEAA